MMESSVYIWLVIAILAGTILPVGLVIYWKRKNHCSLKPMWIGAIIFVVFALGLESIPKLFLFAAGNPVSDYVLSHAWAYTLAGCLLAGVFEEVGRFVAFRFFLKKHDNKETSVTYGIGHSGIESILLFSYASVSYLILALMVGQGMTDTLTASYTGEQLEQFNNLIHTVSGFGAMTCILGICERIFAIILHISMSVVVFKAVKERKMYLLGVAILIHMVFDVPAALMQFGVLNMATTEILLGIMSVTIGYVGIRTYRQMKGYGLS